MKLKALLNFESSTHSVVVKWPVEFGFIVGSRYVQVYPLANQICVHTCKVHIYLVSQRISLCIKRHDYEDKLNRPLLTHRVGGAFKFGNGFIFNQLSCFNVFSPHKANMS